MKDQVNINGVWGALLIEELVRHGVDTFVIAPGSRSTPLVVAAARNERARCQLCVDERAAAFFAIGHARGCGRPAAVITTSGTAVANLGPAVAEAANDGVPLLLLTADRPFELRDCGANQTIQQTDRFGGDLRWQSDLPPPDDQIPARVVLTTAAHAVSRAINGAGPVQVNCQFREPLAPTPAPWDPACLTGTERWLAGETPFTRISQPQLALSSRELDDHAQQLRDAGRGVLIAAGWDPLGREVTALASALGWPVWADVRSGLRLGDHSAAVLPHLDRTLKLDQDTAVVQLGGRFTSQRLQDELDSVELASYLMIAGRDERMDPGHRVRQRVLCAPTTWCREMLARLDGVAPTPDLALMTTDGQEIERALAATIDDHGELSEPFVARWLTSNMREGDGLFLSSSTPIRDVQRYGASRGPALHVAANRGASGIDGVIASAAGFAAGLGRPVTVLIGDLALLHDLGSLALLKDLDQPVTVVALNNGGGSIFTQLPIAQHQDVFSPYFDAPHSIQFGGTASDLGLDYHLIEDREALSEQYAAAAKRSAPTLLEVRSSLALNSQHHQRIEAAIRDAVSR